MDMSNDESGIHPAPKRRREPIHQSIILSIRDSLNVTHTTIQQYNRALDSFKQTETLEAIEAAAKRGDVVPAVAAMNPTYTDAVARELLHFWKHVLDGGSYSALTLIREYPQLPPADDYSVVDQKTQDQIVALTRVATAVQPTPHTAPHFRYINRVPIISDERLIKLIMDNPERADDISFIINERGQIDVEIIHAYLQTGSPALFGGVI